MASDSKTVYQQLLVVRSQLGDRAALNELVGLWEQRLLFYIRRLLSDEHDAQQVLQEVWIKVLSGLAGLQDPARFAPWLYSLARYTAIDHLRDAYARRELLATASANSPDHHHDAGLEQFDDADQVHYGLSKVSVVDREVLTLFFFLDLSVNDVAAVLGIPAGTVKSRLYHARQALREVLERRGDSQS